jgi:acetyl esterase/lipase
MGLLQQVAHLWMIVSFLLPVISGAPTGHFLFKRAPQDPSVDPFYQPPAGFETKPLGTILRQRSVVTAFFGRVPNPVEAHQLLYRTTATNGSAIAAVTTVFKPLFPKNDRFVSFHTAYDASSVSCNPSYQYQLGVVPEPDQASGVIPMEYMVIQLYLASGYVVSSPDYEGPDAAFTPGHLEGMVTLDSMRAVVNFRKTLGISSKNPMIFGTGYSGGAIASGWAASLQSSYASELNIKGWAMGGIPANLTGTLLHIDDSPSSGFLPVAINGLLKPSAYGAQLQPILNRVLAPEGKAALQTAATQCTDAALNSFRFQSILSTDFQSLGPDILYDPVFAPILRENIMGLKASERPVAPVLLYHATKDQIIPYENAKTLVDNWCDQGASVKFTTYKAGGHGSTGIVGLPDVFKFAESAFAGTLVRGCMKDTKLDDAFDPLALGANLEPFMNALQVALNEMDSDA